MSQADMQRFLFSPRFYWWSWYLQKTH